jgi:chaperonin GroEL (HSP60 family)
MQMRRGGACKTGALGDMVQFGILDPTKVTRTALLSATSIAGLKTMIGVMG